MKRQYLTYYSLQWSRCFFRGKCAVYMQRHWSSHILGFPSMCSDSFAKLQNAPRSPPAARLLLSKPALARASHLVTMFFDVDSLLQCISFLFEGLTSTMQRGLKFPILQVLQCNIPGAGYALYIFHKRTPSPESEMWEKSVHQGIYWHKQLRDFQVGDETSCYHPSRLCISLQNRVNVQINAAGLHLTGVCIIKHNC